VHLGQHLAGFGKEETMKLARVLLTLVAVSAGAAIPVHATVLDGQTVRLTYEYPTLGTIFNLNSFDLLVGPGVEISGFPVGDPRTNIDFSDTNIYVTYNSLGTWNVVPFNGFHVFDAFGTIPAFTSVTMNADTNLLGFDASRITFDDDNIWVNWQGLSFDTATVVSLDIAGNQVPEPTTIMLFGLGIPGLVRAARRRQN
jgi:hypothetical protein